MGKPGDLARQKTVRTCGARPSVASESEKLLDEVVDDTGFGSADTSHGNEAKRNSIGATDVMNMSLFIGPAHSSWGDSLPL